VVRVDVALRRFTLTAEDAERAKLHDNDIHNPGHDRDPGEQFLERLFILWVKAEELTPSRYNIGMDDVRNTTQELKDS
jgi:hypothetical protein